MTTAKTATVKVFIQALRGFTKFQRQTLLEALLREKTFRDDLLDLATVEARRHEPGRPLRDYLAQRFHRHSS